MHQSLALADFVKEIKVASSKWIHETFEKQKDFGWQDGYIFADMVALPKGTRLDGEVVWDNSATNPSNVTPPVLVKWGEQSRDEMGSVTLDMLPHNQEERKTMADALNARSSRDTTAAIRRDPSLREYLDEIVNGRSKVFQNGERKQ